MHVLLLASASAQPREGFPYGAWLVQPTNRWHWGTDWEGPGASVSATRNAGSAFLTEGRLQIQPAFVKCRAALELMNSQVARCLHRRGVEIFGGAKLACVEVCPTAFLANGTLFHKLFPAKQHMCGSIVLRETFATGRLNSRA